MNARRKPTRSRIRLVASLLAMALAALVIAGGLAPAQAQGNAPGNTFAPIRGSGSTWSANALEQWMRNVYANYQWNISYNPSGSTVGRNEYANNTADFGVSEIPYNLANSNEPDNPPVRKFSYMPIVAGGTAFMYNLEIGGQRVTNLRLSGEVIAKIFTNVITVWNDPAIAADNPSLRLPATPIVPVVRSDGSGATAQFAIWMRQTQPAIWNAYCAKVGRRTINGACGITSNYPTITGSKFVARKGADGVSAYTAAAASVGAITFVEYSYALNANFPVVKLLNAAGYYNEPTASNVAVALLQAQINQDESSQNYLTQDLSRVYGDMDPRTYPLSSYSYIIMPTALEGGFTRDKGLTLSGFTSYFLCEGQRQAEVLGYSPLPVNLVLGGQNQIRKIPGRDPKFTEFTIAKCNNPTLDPSDPNGNALAKKAPFPPACDRKGTSQCTTGTGGAKGGQTAANGTGGSAGGGPAGGGPGGPAANDPGGTGPGSGPGSGAAPGGGPAGANADGQAVSVDAAPIVVNANPQTIPSSGAGLVPVLAVVAAGAGILGATLIPPLLGRRSRGSVFPPATRDSRSNR